MTRRDLFKRILGCAIAPAITVSRPKFRLTYATPEHRLHVYDGGVNFVRYQRWPLPLTDEQIAKLAACDDDARMHAEWAAGLNYLERKTPGRWGG